MKLKNTIKNIQHSSKGFFNIPKNSVINYDLYREDLEYFAKLYGRTGWTILKINLKKKFKKEKHFYFNTIIIAVNIENDEILDYLYVPENTFEEFKIHNDWIPYLCN